MTSEYINRVLIPNILAIVALFICVVCAWTIADGFLSGSINTLLVIVGAATGWIAGILLTPEEQEVEDFVKLRRAILTFLSGYVVAKLDPIFAATVGKDGHVDDAMLGRFLLFLASFLVAGIFVFKGRKFFGNMPKTGAITDIDS